jgi:integrase
MHASNLTARSFKPLLKRAGLPDYTAARSPAHVCHSVWSRKVYTLSVQELLGHANIGITLDTYSHVLPSMGNQTVAAMERVLP